MDSLSELLRKYGQEHLLRFYDELTDEQKSQLNTDIAEVDWARLIDFYNKQVCQETGGDFVVKPTSKIDDNLIEELPHDCINGTLLCSQSKLEEYRQVGLTNIGQRKVAALLLAGGQGTRLGFEHPKGMYDVGAPINKSLFQLQAERISQLGRSVASRTDDTIQIIWYIMTSEATMAPTREFFIENNYFGLDQSGVVFFEQNTLPSFSFDGKALLADKHKLAKAPDGNGGIYKALVDKEIIDHMTTNGVEFVHVYCVDNILVRVCDPVFLGYCISKKVDIGVKVVEKIVPNESLGVICKFNDKYRVIEYSEISDEIARRRDNTNGKLVFRAGSICDHFFSVEFLRSLESQTLPFHIAIKKIPHIDLKSGLYVKPDKPNGLKFEKFIFDVFEYTNKLVVWEVVREDEFSPLKNGPGSENDNPSTALKALIRSYELGLLTS